MEGNLAYARESSACALMAVVKAGAYGHGLEEIARKFEAAGVEFLGVANVGEARRIREVGVKSAIYLLGATWNEEREEIVARSITPCISNIEEARDFNRIASVRGVCLPVHIAIDTGMGRGGFLPDDITDQIAELRDLQSLGIEGIASHLSSADEDEEFTNRQIQAFENVIASLGGAQAFKWRHLSNSAGIMGFPKGSCNLARPGLMLYGVSPFPADQERLRNVMTLKSRITITRNVPPGHGISYGHTHVTTEPTRIATVGIGYGDGYPRHVSGKGAEVCIRGKRFPLLGRVTMDQMIIALGDDTEVEAGDEVELFGPSIPVSELSTLADTIPWEIFTGITPRVLRTYR